MRWKEGQSPRGVNASLRAAMASMDRGGLTLIIATRGRPDRCSQMVHQTIKNVKRDDTKVLVCFDEDDSTVTPRLFPKDSRIIFSVKPREDTRGEKYDRALTEAPAFLYAPTHDCLPILTPGFDQIMLDKAKLFPDGIGVVRSPFQLNGTFPPNTQAMTAKWVEKVGYIYSRDYPFWFIDHEVHDIARQIGRYFMADIKIAVDHPGTTFRLRELEFWTTYYDLMALERRAKARAIIDGEDFLTPDWQKVDLRKTYVWIEDEARLINNGVRARAAEIEAQRGDNGCPDDGYLRAKARAEQKLSEFLEALKAAA